MCSKRLIYPHILEATYVHGGPSYRNREQISSPNQLGSKQFLQIHFLKKNIQNKLNDTTHCYKSQHRKLKYRQDEADYAIWLKKKKKTERENSGNETRKYTGLGHIGSK